MNRLNKTYQYLVLCEDKQTQCFVNSLLRHQGIQRHKIRFQIGQEGCGEQYVRECLPDAIQDLRSNNHIRRVLVAMTDSDQKAVGQRKKMLKDQCAAENVKWRQQGELLFLLIPKRNIETWMHYYSGDRNATNENTDYGHQRGNESACRQQAEEMSDDLAAGKLKGHVMSSFAFAQDEYDRICGLQI